MSKQPDLTILVDRREQKPWDFTRCKGVEGVVEATLKTADYTVERWDRCVCVERKHSPAELANNLFHDADRFGRELERMKTFAEAHVVLCFGLEDLLAYPCDDVSALSYSVRRKIKVSGTLLLRKLLDVQSAYPHVHWWFAGTRGRDLALALMRSAVRNHPQEEITVAADEPEKVCV